MSEVTTSLHAGPAGPAGRGTPPGSLRYFAVLFAPAGLRAPLQALYDFEAEIRDTVDAQAHEVAHTRLQWWRAEVDRCVAGQPLHPVTIALQPLRDCASADLSLLHEVLVAADLDLARMTYATQQELEAYCFRCSGALQTLAAAGLAGRRVLSDAERDFARDCGSALRQTEILRDFRVDVARGRLYAPLQALTEAGIEPESLAGAQGDRLAPLLREWQQRVSANLASLPSRLTKDERRTQRPGLVLAALHRRLLARVHPAPSDEPRAEVPPLSRLWTAWSTAIRNA